MRELHEELGVVHSSPMAPLCKIPPTPENGMEFVQVYRITHNSRFAPATAEIDAGNLVYDRRDRHPRQLR